MGSALAIDEKNFQTEIINSTQPVLVDFWATWCGPCRAIAPMVEELATKFAGRAKVAKIDVDSNQGLAQRYNVRSIPTLLFFKDGQVVDSIVGVPSKSGILAEKLEALI